MILTSTTSGETLAAEEERLVTAAGPDFPSSANGTSVAVPAGTAAAAAAAAVAVFKRPRPVRPITVETRLRRAARGSRGPGGTAGGPEIRAAADATRPAPSELPEPDLRVSVRATSCGPDVHAVVGDSAGDAPLSLVELSVVWVSDDGGGDDAVHPETTRLYAEHRLPVRVWFHGFTSGRAYYAGARGLAADGHGWTPWAVRRLSAASGRRSCRGRRPRVSTC